MNLRSLTLSRKVIAVVLLAAVTAGAVWGALAWSRSRDRLPLPSEAPVGRQASAEKTQHPPITSLRDRMLRHFHGQASHTFTTIPGFGLERMMPLYKKVPYEVPFFSPGEIEADQGPAQPPAPLKVVFDESLAAFRDPSAPTRGAKPDKAALSFGDSGAPGFGQPFRGTVAYGLQVRLLDLIGLADRDNPKAYSGGRAFELLRMSAEDRKNPKVHATNGVSPQFGKAKEEAEKEPSLSVRPLDLFEAAGVAELLKGKDTYIRHKDRTIRMLGALRATGQCLECHAEAKKGDLLGAFSYTFVDTNGVVFKEAKKK